MTRPRALLRGLWSAWQWHRVSRRSFSYPYMPVLERMAYTLDAIARSVGPAEEPDVKEFVPLRERYSSSIDAALKHPLDVEFTAPEFGAVDIEIQAKLGPPTWTCPIAKLPLPLPKTPPQEQPSSKDCCPPQCPCQVTFGGDEE